MITLRRAKAALASIPRASQLRPHAGPRAVPSAHAAPFRRAAGFALLALVLGGALLYSTPAEAQTATVLVSNTGQQPSDTPFLASLESDSNRVAQAFTTGANTRYELDSIGFRLHSITDTSTAGSELTVTLNEDNSGSPGKPLCILADPPSFASSGTHTFTAPTTGSTPCPQLSANTTYFAVLERANDHTGTILVNVTGIDTEDADSLPAWTISSTRHSFQTTSGWLSSSAESHMIEVKGGVSTEVTVPAGGPLIPSGLAAGDKFRLLFLTASGHSPTSTDIADYNTYVQGRAAAGHADIQDYSSWFRILGSTADTDARDNTGTTYTATEKGVPIYWLNGDKVADEYEDFYDGSWANEANPRGGDGATITGDRVWTGSKSDGTEADSSTEAGSTSSESRALGTNPARAGRLNHSSSGPLDASEAFTTDTSYPYYALSGVLVVGEAVNSLATGVPTITGTPRVGEVLTADTSGIADVDGLGTFTYQWVRVDEMTQTDVGTDASTYTLMPGDGGKKIKVKVSFTDAEGTAEGPLSSIVTGVINGPATGSPTISGKPRVGKRLTASTSDIADPGGTASADFTYQWVRVDGMTNTDIGTDSSTYTLGDDDADKQIKVEVRFTDDEGKTEGPLESLPTESVVADDVLVQNTAKPATTAAELSSGSSSYGQRFTTGPHVAGYTLGSIGVPFTEIGDTSTVGSELTVTLNEESSGSPGDALCTLSDPGSFSASGLHAFSAPTTGTPCPELAPETTYFVVLSRANSNADAIKWAVTATLGQDAGSEVGWTIEDRGHQYTDTSSTWAQLSTDANLLIRVKGALDQEVTVPPDWALIPSGLSTGDTFRLLFITDNGNPSSSNIATYNNFVQAQAAAGHADIQDYSFWFRVVGSTQSTDARDNTGTTYTATEKGVPIYWLDGSKVVDDYEDFYDGGWDDEANPRGADGATIMVDQVWTGSTNAGAEAFRSGDSEAFGTGPVRVGRPNGSGGPLDSGNAYVRATDWRYYALSGVFVVAAGNATPMFSAETATRTLPENSGAGVNVVGGAITATDRNSGDTLTYSLTGTDAGSFEIDLSGQLKTKAGVTHNFNFEAAKKSYSVTINVSDSKDADGVADTVDDDTIAVTINLTNVDEAGTVTLPSTFSGGTEATASVTDPDGTVSGESWLWATGERRHRVVQCNIGGATSASYTPVAADVGKYLRATVTYKDPAEYDRQQDRPRRVGQHGGGQQRRGRRSTMAPRPRATLPENSAAGVNVAGGTITATDGDSGDTLTYSLTGADAGSFEIDSRRSVEDQDRGNAQLQLRGLEEELQRDRERARQQGRRRSRRHRH